jgi:hypothetical protein
LTVEGGAGNQVTNPPLRIASQAMNDMQRIGARFGLTTGGYVCPESSRRHRRRSSMGCLDDAATRRAIPT